MQSVKKLLALWPFLVAVPIIYFLVMEEALDAAFVVAIVLVFVFRIPSRLLRWLGGHAQTNPAPPEDPQLPRE